MDNTFNDQEFINFGRLLDKNHRTALIKYWNDAEKGIFREIPDKIKKYTDVIDKLFRDKKISKTLTISNKIVGEIKQSIFTGFEQIEKNLVANHPFVKEETSLYNWRNDSSINLIKKGKSFLKTIKKYYKNNEYNIDFFEDKIEQLNKKENQKNVKDLELEQYALGDEMIDRWDYLLNNKKDNWYLSELEKWREKYLIELYNQIDQFEKIKELLGPFTNELGRLWDLSKGGWKNIGFEILSSYAKLIEQEPEILELANYLGRMQGEREEIIEKLIASTKIIPKIEIIDAGKEELIGIHESSDINHLLPSEVALLGDKTVEALFYLKLSEKKLLTYDFHGYISNNEEIIEEINKEVPEGETKGPIIICVDTSGSMHGVPERVAKTLCFAILRVALLQNRRCYLISFSTGIETIELSDFYNNLPLLIQFLSHSFHGGTDATPALREAVKMLNDENYSKADVLMISDFIMGNLDINLEKEIYLTKENGTEYHSLSITSSGNKQALDLFDNNWIYQMGSAKPFSQILENIEKLRRNDAD